MSRRRAVPRTRTRACSVRRAFVRRPRCRLRAAAERGAPCAGVRFGRGRIPDRGAAAPAFPSRCRRAASNRGGRRGARRPAGGPPGKRAGAPAIPRSMSGSTNAAKRARLGRGVQAKLELGEHAERALAADEERNEGRDRPSVGEISRLRPFRARTPRPPPCPRSFRSAPSTVRRRALRPSRPRSSKGCSTENGPT